jgi:replicative DNA helicase
VDFETEGCEVVDYIGLMQSDRREERREREIASITTSLKHLAGELDIAVLALSQFSRAPERREDRTPRLSDLRDSGSVEQDADVVMFLHEERADNPAGRGSDCGKKSARTLLGARAAPLYRGPDSV